jgi:phospholipid-binding lipoprotein MlaA
MKTFFKTGTNWLSPFLFLIWLSGCAHEQRYAHTKPAAATPLPKTKAALQEATSGAEVPEVEVERVSDPLERVNRTTFRFNDTLITHVFRPLSKGYAAVVPRPVRSSISNFFVNLDFPVRFSNNILQGRIVRSQEELWKFLINSTAGIGGLFKVSDHVPALRDVPAEDFGLTLGRWGFGPGPYLVVPVLGPSNFRDSAGYAGDYVLNPLNWYQVRIFDHKYISNAARYALAGSRFTNDLPKTIETYAQMKQSAVDPYIAVRNAYLAYRSAQQKK